MEIEQSLQNKDGKGRSLLIAKIAFWMGVINAPIIIFIGFINLFIAAGMATRPGFWFVSLVGCWLLQGVLGVVFLIHSGMVKNRTRVSLLVGIGHVILIPLAFYLFAKATEEPMWFLILLSIFSVAEFMIGLRKSIAAGRIHHSFGDDLYSFGVAVWGISVPVLLFEAFFILDFLMKGYRIFS